MLFEAALPLRRRRPPRRQISCTDELEYSSDEKTYWNSMACAAAVKEGARNRGWSRRKVLSGSDQRVEIGVLRLGVVGSSLAPWFGPAASWMRPVPSAQAT